MADYIVKDTELTSVANAIRTAGGTNSLLSFPNGFVSAVGNISGGGGSSDFSTAEVTITGTGGGTIAINMPVIVDGIIGADAMDYCIIMTGVYTVPLGQNGTYITVDADVSDIAGDIEDAGKGHFLITGDCTITIS